MKHTSKGISTVVLFTAFTLALIFCFIWINTGKLSYSLLTHASVYGWSILFSVIAALPTAIFQKRGYCVSFLILFLISLCMIANIMYYNVFGCQIPLYGYCMIKNLKGFELSVLEYFNPWLLILPFTILTGYLIYKILGDYRIRISIWILLPASVLAIVITFNYPEHFKETYSRLKLTHEEYPATTVLFSPITNLWYQSHENSKQDSHNYNKSIINKIIEQNQLNLRDRSNGREYNSIVIILVESLESFVIDLKIDNICITPNLTALAHDENTFYAPYVESEVGIARSMDAQLIVNCGILPPSNEAFCFQYAGNHYPSIAKAFSTQNETTTISLTTDFPSTYNQDVISRAFGYNHLLTRSDYISDPPHLPHVDDSLFFSQSIKKLENDLWHADQSAVVQIITYSTHQPFRLPANTLKIKLPGINPKLSKYLNVVRYTDAAIGRFMEYLKQREDFDSMLVVIVGDHNVFSKFQYETMGIDTLSGYKEPFIPLLIMNSEISGIQRNITCQSAIYPTILELLGITENVWPGVGRSVFNRDTVLYDTHAVSDYIIRKDFLR